MGALGGGKIPPTMAAAAMGGSGIISKPIAQPLAGPCWRLRCPPNPPSIPPAPPQPIPLGTDSGPIRKSAEVGYPGSPGGIPGKSAELADPG